MSFFHNIQHFSGEIQDAHRSIGQRCAIATAGFVLPFL